MLKDFIFRHGRWAKKKVPYQELTIDGETWKGRRNTSDRWKIMRMPDDMSGMNVLDIGCQIGAFCLESKRRNADFVLGTDNDNSYLECARKVAKHEHLDIHYMQANFNDAISMSAVSDAFPHTYDYVLLLSVIHYVKGTSLPDFLKRLSFKNLIVEGHAKKFNDPGAFQAYADKHGIEGTVEHIGFNTDRGNRPVWIMRSSN